jgi:PKHD-type hydroxylase
MFVPIPNVLSTEEVSFLVDRLSSARFVDGRSSAAGRAATVKNNLQLAPDAEGAQELRDVVSRGLLRSDHLKRIAMPKIVMAPVFNRYDAGMHYEQHVDAPTTRDGVPLRLDVSLTLFLSDPKSYEGGELVIETLSGGIGVKLAAGHAAIYPASTLHRVAKVRSGTRFAAITWVHSLLRDPAKRELVCELELALTKLEERVPEARAELDLLRKTHHNLIRMWTE